MHTPVFHDEVIEALQIQQGDKIIDCTAGEGGHLNSIAGKGARVLALDYDADQIIRLREQIKNPEVTLVNANFKDIAKVARDNGFNEVNGIVMDLGLSFRQLTSKGIGLSFKNGNEPLDMRVMQTGKSAAVILNSYSQEELSEMFIKNAESTKAAELAQSIVVKRKANPFQVVQDLLDVLHEANASENTAQLFQALRIEVNGERENLMTALDAAIGLLKHNGRLVVITFHSLEDRWVKQFGKAHNELQEVKVKIPFNKRMKFERSAQLRVYSKI